MNRSIFSFVLSLILLLSGSQSYANSLNAQDRPYEDAKRVLETLAECIETFVQNMSEAEEAKEIALVLNTLAESMEGLAPKIKAIREKYPELDSEDTHPEELKPLLQRIDKDFREMMSAYAKVQKNMDDESVKAADDKFKQAMSIIG